MAERIWLNDGWLFSENYEDAMSQQEYDQTGMTKVRIPHTVKETPFSYFDEQSYQMVSGYRRHFFAKEEWKEKRVFLTFEAAAHEATVFLNGEKLGVHASGYTAFSFEVTPYLKYGEDNVIAVRLDSRESLNVPPFGHVVDYMTFGGLYREVYFTVTSKSYIKDVFYFSKLPETVCFSENSRHTEGTICAKVQVETAEEGCYLRQSIRRLFTEELLTEPDSYVREEILGETRVEEDELATKYEVKSVALWDVEKPALYLLKTELLKDGHVLDTKETRFGFRTARFEKEGFFLNGRKLKIRGLNRHQSYPYVGYAMPSSMQRYDADILKRELGVNAVRTSHYPQSHAFLDRCEELGILVFTEFPGWQHIGDDAWKAQALINLEEMIVQYRNHCSIILWGVRINESVDDDAFYEKTNALAHKLDATRQTGGVRAGKKGHLLEDVYTYNDFSHNGENEGCEPKKNVTSDMEKPYLITEYNGHMYPTKSFDWEEHRVWHAMRHAKVLDSVAEHEDICGSFGWCMFDYNTHKDFGSGDRICYHGVMDMFRNPKMAAAVYACQSETQNVLEISSGMDIGEHPGCIRGDTWIFTNADAVRMYKNDVFIKEYSKKDSPYPHLLHGPILVDDYIGNQLKENEPLTEKQAKDIKLALNTAAIKGLNKLPLSVKWIAVKEMLFHHMKPQDAVDLFQKYIGDWGGKSKTYTFEAIRDGRVVKTVKKQAVTQVKFHIQVSSTKLCEKETYDVAAARIRAVDENENLLPYYGEPVSFETEGPIAVIGPKSSAFRGGMTGTYIKTIGESGTATLRILDAYGRMEEIKFQVDSCRN